MVRKFLKKILGENFTENNAKLATVNFVIILFMFVLSGVMLFFLPEQISIFAYGRYSLSAPQCFGCLAVSDYCFGY